MNKPHIILGDFNLSTLNNNQSITFLDSMEETGFKQTINYPTHIKGKTLNLVFLPEHITELPQYTPPNKTQIPWSDHSMIRFSIHSHSSHHYLTSHHRTPRPKIWTFCIWKIPWNNYTSAWQRPKRPWQSCVKLELYNKNSFQTINC